MCHYTKDTRWPTSSCRSKRYLHYYKVSRVDDIPDFLNFREIPAFSGFVVNCFIIKLITKISNLVKLFAEKVKIFFDYVCFKNLPNNGNTGKFEKNSGNGTEKT